MWLLVDHFGKRSFSFSDEVVGCVRRIFGLCLQIYQINITASHGEHYSSILLSSTNTDLREMSQFKYHYKKLAPQLCMNQRTDRRRSFLGERCGTNLRTTITSARPTLRVFRDARREFFFPLAMLTNQLGGKRFMSSVGTAQAWCHFVNYR